MTGINDIPTILSTRNVGKEFAGVWVLKDINFDLRPGEIHALVGENGAGKSTFIKILSGVHYPSTGTLEVEGQPRSFNRVSDSERAGIRTVHQEINLVPFFRVYQNMFIGNELGKSGSLSGLLDNRLMRQKAREIVEILDIELDVNQHTHLLDASMERIVQIGQVLVQHPKVLIFDEPTTSLGENERKNLLRVIAGLKKTGVGIIYITHNLEEVMELADNVTVFRDGRITGAFEGDEIDRNAIISSMVGHERLTVYERDFGASRGDEVVLSVRGLRNKTLRDISFDICTGEIFGIAGVVGSGKSEIAKALFGIDRIESGEIEYLGRPYKPSLRQSLREGIALVPEERKDQGIVENFSVGQNTTLAYLDDFCTAGMIRSAQETEVAERYRDELSIKSTSIHQLIKYLSGGNQQKVILARWLAGDFLLGIFDEPTKGIDIKAKEEIYRLIDSLATGGKAILLLSSYLPELTSMCDRILVIKDGRNVAEFNHDSPFLNEKLMHAMLGGVKSEQQ